MGEMVIDRAGGLQVAVRTFTNALNSAVYSVHPPGGSWTPAAVVSDRAVGPVHLAVDSSFRPHVAWTGSGAGDTVTAVVAAAGGAWTGTLGDTMSNLVPTTVDLMTDPADNPQIFLGQGTGAGFLLRASASGTTLLQAVPNVSANAGQALDGVGRTHLVYSTPTQQLQSITVGLDGSLGPVETITTEPTTTGRRANVVTVGPAKLAVVFADSSGVHLATKVGEGTWTVAPVSNTGGLGCLGKCLAADATGNLHLLLLDNSTLRYLRTDSNGQWQSESVDLGSGNPTVNSLGVDGTGVVHLFSGVRTAANNEYRHTYRCPVANAGQVYVPRPAGTGTWQELSSTVRPPQRRTGQGLVYDSLRHEMVLFGGRDLGTGEAPPETWTFPDGGTGWVRRAAATSPNPGGHSDQGMAFDSGRGRVVLMGLGTANAEGVWDWDGAAATWTVRPLVDPHPAFLPPFGQSPPVVRLAYDSNRAKVVVLLGGSCPSRCWELWDWDPTPGLFTPRPKVGTAPATLSSIAYDAISGMLIGLGGGETWEWNPDDGTWTNRTGGAPASDPTSGEVVYEGAGRFMNYDGVTTREWSRTAPTWRTRPLSQVGPSPRVDAFVAYHAARGTVWMFGGWGLGTYLNPSTGAVMSPPGWAFDTTFEWRGPEGATAQ